MTISFDWAVFGYVEGGHGLIKSSLSIEMSPLLNTLAALSDRPTSDPPSGTKRTPYLSGFPYDRWYVLMRTFSDPTVARTGMVRSFCLLIPINELEGIDDLYIYIDRLPTINSTPNEWNHWKDNDRGQMNDMDASETLRERKPVDIANLTPLSVRLGFIAALLNQNDLPAVWTANQDDFEIAITGIWALLPSVLRGNLRFGRSYAPNDLGEPKPHFVTTPINAASRWTRERILESLDREPNSRAESFLLGDSLANSLGQFLSSLPVIREFSKLRMADSCLIAVEAVKAGEDSKAITAARLLQQFAPEKYQAEELKVSLLNTLNNILQTGNFSDIRRFANLSFNAFTNAEERLEKSLTARVKSNLDTFHDIDREIVKLAFKPSTILWWKGAVSVAIVEQVGKLSTELARNLWGWWLNDPELVLPLKEHLPSNADLLLYETAPAELDREKANFILKIFSQNLNSPSNDFPRLLTYLEVISEVANDQILQTCLKRSSDVDIALNIFRKCIGDRVFLDLALTVFDERVFIEAGTCCFEDPILLNQIAPDNVYWRKIWLAAIQAGADPLAGILQPNEAMATVLDEFLAGEAIEKNLLLALSYTHVANLIDYSSRTEIWSKLPLEAKGGFFEATAKGVFDRWRDDSNFQPEPELTESILKPGCFTEAIRRSDRGLDKMTSRYITFLVVSSGRISNAEEVMRVLRDNNLAISDLGIKQFAEWIRKKNWISIAEMAFECYQRKPHSIIFNVLVELTGEILPSLKHLQAIAANTLVPISSPIMSDELHSDDVTLLVNMMADLGFAYGNHVELFRNWLHQAKLPKNWIMDFGEWSPSTSIAARKLITWAESKGSNLNNNDFSTLGSILQVLIFGEIGLDKASIIAAVMVRYKLINNQRLLNELIIKYQVPLALKESTSPQNYGPEIDWQEPTEELQLQSWFNAEPDFLDVGFLMRGIQQAVSVCRIETLAGKALGTGVLIDRDLLLTNYHVLQGENFSSESINANAQNIRLRFGYFTAATGTTTDGQIFRLDSHQAVVQYSPTEKLDYVLLRVEAKISNASQIKKAECDFESYPSQGMGLTILQHPEGESMKLAVSRDGITSVLQERGFVQYAAKTAGGSSGSPCFNEDWKVVALHHAERSKSFGSIREGILLSSIYQEIKSHLNKY
jgi:endonuclease G, mitochondrial